MGLVVSRQKRKIYVCAFKEEFTSEGSNTSFHDSLDGKFLNLSILLFVNCLLRIILFLLFPLSVFIFTSCTMWVEKPKSTTDTPGSKLSLFVTITSIKDSELGVILFGDLTIFIELWLIDF